MTISVKQDKAVYVLDEDNNFVCAHENTIAKQAFTWEGDLDGQMYECNDCGEQVEGSPEFDRADLKASMAYDEWRDNQ